jgi:hypothetical protein
MRKLTETDIIDVMREEWTSRVKTLCEKANITFSGVVGDKDTILVAPELKVQHRKSGLKYTVDSVSPQDVVLRTSEGKLFIVDATTFENEYVLE